ncbi:MAG: putative glycosyltransferase, partial [Nocardioidaceae bacterium]|nr:putative glycosyltransferase [Nocardioidaceae bacterium]
MSVTTLPAARTVPEQAKPPKVARRWATVFAGRPDDPSWARPGLWALLLGTALLYLWDLSSSGFANTFYAAAVQAGSQDLKAWFFGSLDASNFITVDKPPASLWVMGLSARLFGFSSWSLLIPQALMGVGTVALIHASVRRVSGHGAALAAGLVMALTPAAALMFRFDNPDALLVLLMTAAGYFVTRAQEKASGRWLALAGVALGFAFLTKMLQGLLVLPAFALVYLITAPASVRKRLLHLVVAGLTLIASAGWWVVIVALWPAGSRPYIGGSTNNSVIDLVLGYNGLGRIFGQGAGGAGGGGGGGGNGNSGFGGATGLGRMFTSEIGLEISWLLPSALIALALGLYVTRPATRTDSQRAALLMWGGWLIVTGLIFSNMRGTMHPYYTVALAPAIAAILGITVSLLWRIRGTATGSLGFASLIAAAGIWSFSLLADSGSSLRWVLLAVTAASALILCLHAVMG